MLEQIFDIFLGKSQEFVIHFFEEWDSEICNCLDKYRVA